MANIKTYLRSVVSRQQDTRVVALAKDIAAGHDGTLAVIAYGSTLRGVNLSETLVDFYVITETRLGISRSAASRVFGTLLPPNVYYLEAHGLRCKYAVVARQDFQSWTSQTTGNPYFWARFSQPVAVVFKGDEQSLNAVLDDLARALKTANANACAFNQDPTARWTDLFTETYQTELRPESTIRASQLVEANIEYYRTVSELLGNTALPKANWRARRFQGRALSIARLIKAGFTFQGGADYAAWKIERHTGQHIPLTDWQRRHPVIAGLMLLPKLLRRGAIK